MFLKVTTKKAAITHFGIIVLLSMVAILLFFYVYLPVTTNHGEAIKVPDLKGKTIGEVEEIVRVNHLRFQVDDSSYVPGAVPYSVLNQNPEEGSEVKSNRKIYLIIATKNPPMVAMPDLRERSFKQAEITLKSVGLAMLRPNIVPYPYANLVLRQYDVNGKEIVAGTLIPRGTKIRLDVGNGDSRISAD